MCHSIRCFVLSASHSPNFLDLRDGRSRIEIEVDFAGEERGLRHPCGGVRYVDHADAGLGAEEFDPKMPKRSALPVPRDDEDAYFDALSAAAAHRRPRDPRT